MPQLQEVLITSPKPVRVAIYVPLAATMVSLWEKNYLDYVHLYYATTP